MLSITTAGTGNSTTTGTTFSLNCGASFAVGDTMLVVVAADNAGSSGSAQNITSVTDPQSNTYIERLDQVYDNGAASAGAELSFFSSLITTAKITTDQITVTFGVTVVSKAVVIYKITGGMAVFKATTGGGATTGTPTASSDLLAGDVMVGALAVETNAATTGSSGFDGTLSTVANTGTITTSMRCSSQYVLATTAVTKFYSPTLTSADVAYGIIVFSEFKLPPRPPRLVPLHRAAVR